MRFIYLHALLILSLGVYQLNMLISQRFATRFEGAVTYLWYGQRIVEIPQGLFGMAIAAAALPSMSTLVAKRSVAEAMDDS